MRLFRHFRPSFFLHPHQRIRQEASAVPMRVRGRAQAQPRGNAAVVSFAVISLVAGILVGCPGTSTDGPMPSDDPRAISVIEPVNPTGTISGQILDLFTQGPIAGATVTLAHADGEEGTSATTQADGTFELLEVPSSLEIGLLISADGYASAWSTASLPNNAGNLAQDNAIAFAGPVALLPTAAGLAPRYRLLSPQGESVTAASFEVQLDVRFVDDGVRQGQLAGVAAYDAAGDAFLVSALPDLALLAVTLPNARLLASIVPEDTNLDPVLVNVSVATALTASVQEIQLTSNVPGMMDAGVDVEFVEEDTMLEIVGGNVDDLVASSKLDLSGDRVVIPSTLTTGSAVEVLFSRAVDEASFYISFVDRDDNALDIGPVIFEPSDELDQSRITVTSPASGWPAGDEVNILVQALIQSDSGPPQPTMLRRGSFLTSPEGALSLITEGSLVNNGGVVVCPDQATFIRLEINSMVGNRNNNGDAAMGKNQVLAIRVSSDDTKVDPVGQLGLDYEGTNPSTATLQETGNFLASGYSRELLVPFNGAFGTPALGVAQLTIDLVLVLTFNDLATTNLNGSFGGAVVRVPGGAPVGQISGTVSLTTNNAGASCNL